MKLLIILGLLLLTPLAWAESELAFAKTVQNPLATNPETKYNTLPFYNYLNYGYDADKQTQYELTLKPVQPFRFTERNDLVLRSIFSFFNQPSTTGYFNGWGDFNPTLFITPKLTDIFIWGVGPTLSVPTASNKALGSGKWSAGPELCVVYMPARWVFATLASNVWSFAGDKSRETVNQLSLQYFISYNFDRGWYLTSQPTIISNWNMPSSQQWLVPFGGGLGRAFHVGKQAMNCALLGYYNAISPTQIGPQWTLEAKIELLFKDT